MNIDKEMLGLRKHTSNQISRKNVYMNIHELTVFSSTFVMRLSLYMVMPINGLDGSACQQNVEDSVWKCLDGYGGNVRSHTPV